MNLSQDEWSIIAKYCDDISLENLSKVFPRDVEQCILLYKGETLDKMKKDEGIFGWKLKSRSYKSNSEKYFKYKKWLSREIPINNKKILYDIGVYDKKKIFKIFNGIKKNYGF